MLYDQLKKYRNSSVYPFHMPGHKRINIDSDDLIPYGIDLTEIHGFDYLHNPKGFIKAVEEKAANLYHSKRAFLLVNGATGGILASVRAMTNSGDKVLVARNCHKSIYNAIELCQLAPEYILPPSVDEGNSANIYGSISPQSLDYQLDSNPDTKLVIITSPTYEGVCSDIRSISQICKKHGAMLLVDEAHGAHFPFHSAFPDSAITCGADVAVVSLHKTLPSLTQTALLLTNHSQLEKSLQSNLAVFETSSPSYVLMSSVEKCLDYLSDNTDLFNDYVSRLKLFNKRTKRLSKLKILFGENIKDKNIYHFDIGKIIISTASTNLTGQDLSDILRSEYQLETEMSASDYVIAMTSVCDTDEGFERLTDALLLIDSKCKHRNRTSDKAFNFALPKKCFTSSKRFQHTSEIIPFHASQDRISLEYIMAYPPGIPIIVPGEVISEDIIQFIADLMKSGVEVYSSEKNLPDSISVAEL